ncbi:hypothetical protein [Sedimentitalea nanhaiensis]|uniref:Uncharacterized protein n=1 Tax=Sedimentitalea nanhaiensis TaxID=999627 RepID=A0A1I7E161_9RHOB|nr:hypothetical protein [Sedimentitalea nanhaiensis]SFU17646.1 hypothetical protein SAMN05216236_14034 [Sedimentitalea nanhaiensis]
MDEVALAEPFRRSSGQKDARGGETHRFDDAKEGRGVEQPVLDFALTGDANF